MASRDWRPMHHDKDLVVERNGIKNIFMNSPNLAAWFERYLTDWTGLKGWLGRMTSKMKKPVFPGDEITFSRWVTHVSIADNGCYRADVDLAVSTAGDVPFEGPREARAPRQRCRQPLGPQGTGVGTLMRCSAPIRSNAMRASLWI